MSTDEVLNVDEIVNTLDTEQLDLSTLGVPMSGVFASTLMRESCIKGKAREWMQEQVYHIGITFLEDLLGTVAKQNIMETHVNKKFNEMAAKGKLFGVTEEDAQHLQETEKMALEDLAPNVTGFYRWDGRPVLMDYQLRGQLCAAARARKESGGVKQLLSKIQRWVHCHPHDWMSFEGQDPHSRIGRRACVISHPDIPDLGAYVDDPANMLVRPIRCSTPKGDRVAISASQRIPAGAEFEFGISVISGGGITRSILEELLVFGEHCGYGQWRTGGWGRFIVHKMDLIKGGRVRKVKDVGGEESAED